MADAAAVEPARPPFWRNVRVLRFLGQVGFVVLTVLVLRELYLNLAFGLRRQGLDLSFDFLRQRAGFGIIEGISYSPNQSYVRALQVGLVNTLRAAAVGIVVATVFGLIMGVARLSPNWLIRKIAQVYVEVFRNTPLAVQLVFWYFAVVLTLPVIEGGFSLGDFAFLSNRGAAIPWPRAGPSFGTWGAFLLAGVALGAGVWVVRTRAFDRTGRPHHRVLLSLAVLVAVAAAGYVVSGDPVELDVPESTGRGYTGGFQMSPEYAGLLIALVMYTGAFIAEIVRGSILAVSRGQKEAAEALGLSPAQQLRFVVLPQAMRIAIPPLNSQYLNLTKNTSLAILIGYPELVFVGRTIANQAGRATQVLLVWMGAYLVLSLSISFLMNLVNRAVTRRGEGR
ncbi:MAG: ABC transporter permease subunit [Actinobacteria bacterium]|nr:ABC transporter permease subunit [Actinomycetota bacterium]